MPAGKLLRPAEAIAERERVWNGQKKKDTVSICCGLVTRNGDYGVSRNFPFINFPQVKNPGGGLWFKSKKFQQSLVGLAWILGYYPLLWVHPLTSSVGRRSSKRRNLFRVGRWRCDLEKHILGPWLLSLFSASCLPWFELLFFYCVPLPLCFSLRASWPWTETCEPR